MTPLGLVERTRGSGETAAGQRHGDASIAKTFVAVMVLQLAERGRLSLTDRLPDVLPANVVGRFPTAADVTGWASSSTRCRAGVELVGHLGGTAGYRSFVGRVRPPGVTMTLVLNAQDDPTPLILPAVQALAAKLR